MKDIHSEIEDTMSTPLELSSMVDHRGHRVLLRKKHKTHETAKQDFLVRAKQRRISDPDAPMWEELHEGDAGVRQHILGHARLVDFHRNADASKSFDLLRTRLIQTLKQNGWSRIAIAGPTSGCGSTFTAVNLALSMARVPETRTILMDMNMRKPGIARAFDMDSRGQMADFLTGRRAMVDHLTRLGDTLALGLTREADGNAAEALQDPRARRTLERMHTALDPDVVLYDMPPMLAHDDMTAFLPQVDGVLLIADGTKTIARHLAECERMLEGNTPLLGVILNRARASSIKRYH